MHCKATKVLGSRMQHGNANEMLGLSDAMKTTRSPQRRARRKGNKMLGRSDATKTTRSPQQRAHCRATKVSVHGLQSRQCAPATQNESHDWPCLHMEGHLQCAEQQESSSNFSKYCACHAKWISWLIRITYETSFTMRGATRVILQLHQILRLPRKMNLMIDPHHIWNVIYNARSNKSHPPTSPNTAPATQNESHDWSASHMKRHLQCAEQQESSSNFTK